MFEFVVVVLWGGLFGWTLGQFEKKWVYAILAFTILATLVVFGSQ